MTDGQSIPDECELCRRHGHEGEATNPPEGYLDVVASGGESRRLYCCRRCARETTFRNFTPLGDGDP